MILQGNKKQAYFREVRRRLIPILHNVAGIPINSRVNQEDIQKFIKAGAKVFRGVMNNLWKDKELGVLEIVEKLLVHGDILLRRIYHINRKLRDQKLTDLQVFREFSSHLKDEIVSKFLQDSELARHFKRKVALWKSTEPTFADGVKQIFAFVVSCSKC